MGRAIFSYPKMRGAVNRLRRRVEGDRRGAAVGRECSQEVIYVCLPTRDEFGVEVYSTYSATQISVNKQSGVVLNVIVRGNPLESPCRGTNFFPQ